MPEGKQEDYLSCHCAQIQFTMNENRVKWDDEDQQS